jgi:hypothetical protein
VGLPTNIGLMLTGNWVANWTSSSTPSASSVDGAIEGASINPGGSVGVGGGASLSLQGGPTTFGIGVGSKGIGASATWTVQFWPLWGDE